MHAYILARTSSVRGIYIDTSVSGVSITAIRAFQMFRSRPWSPEGRCSRAPGHDGHCMEFQIPAFSYPGEPFLFHRFFGVGQPKTSAKLQKLKKIVFIADMLGSTPPPGLTPIFQGLQPGA